MNGERNGRDLTAHASDRGEESEGLKPDDSAFMGRNHTRNVIIPVNIKVVRDYDPTTSIVGVTYYASRACSRNMSFTGLTEPPALYPAVYAHVPH